MANLTGTKTPGRTTQASLGDIYTDTSSGKQYRCVFSYKDSAKQTFDTSWVEVETDSNATQVKKAPKINAEPKVEEQNINAVEGTINETINESVREKAPQSQKKNYTNYSKNNRK